MQAVGDITYMIYKLDHSIFLWIHNSLEHPVMDHLMSWFTYSGNNALILSYIFITSVIAGLIYRLKYFHINPEKHTRPVNFCILFMLYCLMIYGVLGGISQILKKTTLRPRPYLVHQTEETKALMETTAGEDTESFPSGHAAGAFMMVVILSRKFGGKLKILYGWAALVALSRIYLGAHYPSDVIVGSFLGWLIASFIISGSIRFFPKINFGFT